MNTASQNIVKVICWIWIILLLIYCTFEKWVINNHNLHFQLIKHNKNKIHHKIVFFFSDVFIDLKPLVQFDVLFDLFPIMFSPHSYMKSYKIFI